MTWLGADRNTVHAGVLEIPNRMFQSVGGAVILSVSVDELRQVFPNAGDPALCD